MPRHVTTYTFDSNRLVHISSAITRLQHQVHQQGPSGAAQHRPVDFAA